MSRITAVCAVALCWVVAGATPAVAATKTCHTKPSAQKQIIVTNVSCKKGKTVLRKFFAGDQSPSGYSCKQEQYEGGSTTRCKKGSKIVEQQLAD
jgi:hypothetical protein